MRSWTWVNVLQMPAQVNARFKELENVISELQSFVSRVETIADADTTPSVLGAAVLLTANSGATSISTFDDGEPGRSFKLVFGDANTTLLHGSNLQMSGNTNFKGAAGDTRIFTTDDGTLWREVPQG